MLANLLFIIICLLPELITLGIALLVTIFTDNSIMGIIVGGIIYIILLFTVKREIKTDKDE